MKFRPCIDIHEGKVKQIVGITLKDNSGGLKENFISDKTAAYFAESYKKDSLTGGHVIMLDQKPETVKEALNALKAYPNGLQVGGGINDENAASYLDAGASQVIVTSFVFKNGKISFENIDKLVEAVGKERLILDLSCRKKNESYFVVTDKWQKFTDFETSKKNLQELEKYCAEFLVHGVDVEGQCKGIQEDLVESLGKWARIPTTYAGGAKSIDDLELVERLGKGRIDLSIGSALDIFGGTLSYKKVVDFNKRRGF